LFEWHLLNKKKNIFTVQQDLLTFFVAHGKNTLYKNNPPAGPRNGRTDMIV
jgi:hypothetical protein